MAEVPKLTPKQQQALTALQAAGLRARFKVLVGGGPVTAEWAEKIGADGYGRDALEGVAVAQRLVAGEGGAEC